jgi:hypothetical protein
MWEVRPKGDVDEDVYEMLTTTETQNRGDGTDSDIRTISSVKFGTESYQSTSRLIVHGLCILTALFLIATCVAVGNSIGSTKKVFFNITGIMPSVTLATGDCDSLKYANLSLHLFINCVGTIIIGCSNYLQQSMFLRKYY